MARILVISSTPFFGGAEQFIINTISRLDKWYDMRYIVFNKELAEKLPSDKVIIFKSDSFVGQIKEIKKYAIIYNVDLLFFNGSNIAYSLPLFRGWARLYYRHTTNLYAPANRRWLFKFISNIVYRNADVTIHVSKYSLREQKAGRGQCIYNGIELPEHKHREFTSRPLKLLFCSRLERPKGTREIVEAFKLIDRNVAQLIIVGNGSESDWVKRNLGDSITYLGFQKNVTKLYEESDALILMSEFENFPISIIEAMSHGLPIITTGAGGIAEMVKDRYNGLIVDRTPEAIKSAVENLSRNRELVIEYGENSYRFCHDNLEVREKVAEIREAIESILMR